MAGFDHELAHCVKVHCVMQEVLQIQFFANEQLARFEVNKSLGQYFIFFLTKAAAAEAATGEAAAEPELHSGVELAE